MRRGDRSNAVVLPRSIPKDLIGGFPGRQSQSDDRFFMGEWRWALWIGEDCLDVARDAEFA
jgi:hypothetical protein